MHISGLVVLASAVSRVIATCPFSQGQSLVARIGRRDAGQSATNPNADFDAIRRDIVKMLTNSQDFWPADFGNYGGLMIRLAWHCNGSHRNSDGRGGCDGARIRFNPEHSWADNTNLDKALKLLLPIHDKWASQISWGDLITLTGNTAIESMGGPKLGFCAGRVDDSDGSASLILGPTPEQQAQFPCAIQGNCTIPFGPTTVGLIYVNPEGPMGVPDPDSTVETIRDTFSRMGFSDEETVAIIGGGHAFGKTHGACPTGPGPNPIEAPDNSWPGTCGSGPMMGKGVNTFTSGFEGKWTTKPTTWTNEYFSNLLDYDWIKFTGPGNHTQWKPSISNSPDIRMLTADVALIHDPIYKTYVQKFASNLTYLESVFAPAWYKLMTADMGPHSRCINADAPPAQPWQLPLPAPPANPPKTADVAVQVRKVMSSLSSVGAADADGDGTVYYYGAQFVDLAFQCASTFRATDWRGGCNGAWIRFEPENSYPMNKGLAAVLGVLQPVKDAFGDILSWADLIVIAAQVALNGANVAIGLNVTLGRSDATAGSDWYELKPRDYYQTPEIEVQDGQEVMGLTDYDVVALAGRLRSKILQQKKGLSGDYGCPAYLLNNCYFTTLLGETWTATGDANGTYKNADGSKYMQSTDIALLNVSKYQAIVREFAANQTSFLVHFNTAWTYLMNADLYLSNKSAERGNPTAPATTSYSGTGTTVNAVSTAKASDVVYSTGLKPLIYLAFLGALAFMI
ncbi:heme peroxidase [Chytriomyces sp. MP71]|nr:heme peroxidase [Chytriomyces sp. MP71]